MYRNFVQSAGARLHRWRAGDTTDDSVSEPRPLGADQAISILRSAATLFAAELDGARWEKLLLAERLMRHRIDASERAGDRGVAPQFKVGAPLDGGDFSDVAFVQIALHYLRFATAAYLREGLITFGLVREGVAIPRSARNDGGNFSVEARGWIAYHLEHVEVSAIHDVSRPDDVPFRYIATDEATRSLVLAIRGSFSAADAVLDLAAEDPSASARGHVVAFPNDVDGAPDIELALHFGFLSAARHVVAQATPVLARLLREPRHAGYGVVVCGHSLGSATATIVAMLLLGAQRRDPTQWAATFPPALRVEAWGYGSPPVVTAPESVPRYMHRAVQSFVFQSDWVRSLSRGSVQTYVRRLVRAARSRELGELWRAVAALNAEAADASAGPVGRALSKAEVAAAALAHDGALSWAADRVAGVGSWWSAFASDALEHADALRGAETPPTPAAPAARNTIEAAFAERRALVAAQLAAGALTRAEHAHICAALRKGEASEIAFRDEMDDERGAGFGGARCGAASDIGGGGGGGGGGSGGGSRGGTGGEKGIVADDGSPSEASPLVGGAAANAPCAWHACRFREAVSFPEPAAPAPAPPPSPPAPPAPPAPPPPHGDALCDAHAQLDAMFAECESDLEYHWHAGAVYHLASLGVPRVAPARVPKSCSCCAVAPTVFASHGWCPNCGCRVCSECVATEQTMVPAGALAPAAVCRICAARRSADRLRAPPRVRSALTVQRASTRQFSTFAPSSTSVRAHYPSSYDRFLSALLVDWGVELDGASGLALPRSSSRASASEWVSAVLAR